MNRLREILKGIDQTEPEVEHGWWETSTGADFGAERLREVEGLFETLTTESKVMRAALEDIHQYEGTSYAHARTVAHQGLSGEYSASGKQG